MVGKTSSYTRHKYPGALFIGLYTNQLVVHVRNNLMDILG